MSNIPSDAVNASTPSRFYLAAWRWHFYAGLYVVPFLIMLAVTGLSAGTHDLFVSAVDEAGTHREATITVTIP